MRTVDPEKWSRKLRKAPIKVARPMRYQIREMTALEVRLRRSFCDAMSEFWNNCSIKGVGIANDKNNVKIVRWCCILSLVTLIIFGIAVMIINAIWLKNHPAVSLILHSIQNPLHEIDLPGVALCSYNVISKSGLDSYAKYLYSLERNGTYSLDYIKRNLMAFGGLMPGGVPMDFDVNFTKFLTVVARETNITNIIYKLSPGCNNMMTRCMWRGRRTRCDHLFATRITDFGYCCVFNGRFRIEDKNNTPYRATAVGQENGLTVTVNENQSDFTYVRRGCDGFDMVLFDGRQYPLLRAGIIHVYPMHRGSSMFVTLTTRVQKPSDSLRYYSDTMRGCRMTDFNGRFKGIPWSHCVTECRRQAMVALCMCFPYTKPKISPNNDRTCSLEHISCLEKYLEKLSFFYPGEDEDLHESLQVEQENSVDCRHCRPNCDRLEYATKIFSVPHQDSKTFGEVPTERKDNSTTISIYYTTEEQHLYLLEPNLRFYEVFSFVSCQWVFLGGVTVISFMELIYHCTIRWCYHYKSHARRDFAVQKLKGSE